MSDPADYDLAQPIFRGLTGHQVFAVLHAYMTQPKPDKQKLAEDNGMTMRHVYLVAFSFGHSKPRGGCRGREAKVLPLPAGLQAMLDTAQRTGALPKPPPPRPKPNPVVLEAAARVVPLAHWSTIEVDETFSKTFARQPNCSALAHRAAQLLRARDNIVTERPDGTWLINNRQYAPTSAALVSHANRVLDRYDMPPIWNPSEQTAAAAHH